MQQGIAFEGCQIPSKPPAVALKAQELSLLISLFSMSFGDYLLRKYLFAVNFPRVQVHLKPFRQIDR